MLCSRNWIGGEAGSRDWFIKKYKVPGLPLNVRPFVASCLSSGIPASQCPWGALVFVCGTVDRAVPSKHVAEALLQEDRLCPKSGGPHLRVLPWLPPGFLLRH